MKPNLNALIIEDSENDAQLLVHELEHGGYDVTHERVETESTLKVALEREPWDIIFCDYTLPQFSGEAALRIVTEAGCDEPFIYVSGTIGEDAAVAAMKAGARDYFRKGNLSRLVPAVARELREAVVRRGRRQVEADRDRLIADLQAALAEARTLDTVLPVCACCKNVRDDHGYWKRIEDYIHEHLQAKLNHGMCPACAKRLYPKADAAEKQKSDRRFSSDLFQQIRIAALATDSPFPPPAQDDGPRQP